MAPQFRPRILTPVTRNLRTVLLALGGLALSAGAVVVIARSFDFGGAIDILRAGNPLAELVAVALLAVGIVVRTARWRVLLPAPGGKRVSIARLLPVLLVGYLGNTLLPARLGEAVRAVAVSRREPIGIPESAGSVALERVIDTAVLAVLGFVAAALLRAPAWLVGGTAAVAAVAITVVLALLLAGPSVTRWLDSRHDVSVARIASRFLRTAVLTPRFALLAAVVLTAVAWSIDTLLYSAAATALGLELGPAQALVIVAAASLGTIIPSAPGYIGTFELAASTAGVAIGLGTGPALALAILVHLLTLVPLAAAGVIGALLIGADLRGAVAGSPRTAGLPRA